MPALFSSCPSCPSGSCAHLPGRCQHAARLFFAAQRCRLDSSAPPGVGHHASGARHSVCPGERSSHREVGSSPPNAGRPTSHQDGEVVCPNPDSWRATFFERESGMGGIRRKCRNPFSRPIGYSRSAKWEENPYEQSRGKTSVSYQLRDSAPWAVFYIHFDKHPPKPLRLRHVHRRYSCGRIIECSPIVVARTTGQRRTPLQCWKLQSP